MNIKEYINHMKGVRGDRSFAFLAERCETSEKNPFRIRPAEPIKADEVLVCVLCGANRNEGDYIREYNGYLKKVDEFVKNSPKLKGYNIRVCVAVCNFGKYHNTDRARYLQHLKQYDYKKYKKMISELPPEIKEEILNPCYIQDIFNATMLPRISENKSETMRNIRRLNFVTHCHGAYEVVEMEDKMSEKLAILGYTDSDKEQIFAQQMSLNFNPEGAKNHAKSRFFNIQSAADSHNQQTTLLEEYLLMNPSDFGIAYIKHKNIKTLMCAQVDKRGVEGNPPPVYVVRSVEDLFRDTMEVMSDKNNDETKEPEEEDYVSEHSFMGFSPKSNMSRGAKKIQKIAGNILENSLLNSVRQNNDEFVPLPSFLTLAAGDRTERFEIAKAYIKGWKMIAKTMAEDPSKLAAYKAYRQKHTIEL